MLQNLKARVLTNTRRDRLVTAYTPTITINMNGSVDLDSTIFCVTIIYSLDLDLNVQCREYPNKKARAY